MENKKPITKIDGCTKEQLFIRDELMKIKEMSLFDQKFCLALAIGRRIFYYQTARQGRMPASSIAYTFAIQIVEKLTDKEISDFFA